MDDVAENVEVYEYKGKGIFEPAIDIKELLLQIIEEKGPITRSELVRETGIPRSTIYDTLVKLMMDEKVQKYAASSRKRGRPRIFYEIWSDIEFYNPFVKFIYDTIEKLMKNEEIKEVKKNASKRLE